MLNFAWFKNNDYGKYVSDILNRLNLIFLNDHIMIIYFISMDSQVSLLQKGCGLFESGASCVIFMLF